MRKLFFTLIAFCCIYLSANATQAAEMGEITVLSAIGQPLRAEIELIGVSPDEIGRLFPKIASAEAFRDAGILYQYKFLLIQFIVEERGARCFILLTTKYPINESPLNILIDLYSGSEKSTKAYALTLKPPEPPSPSSVHFSMQSPSSVTISQTINTDAIQGASYYQVKTGDTLSKIARRFKDSGISLEQMLVAIQRNNPSAFIKGNMNLIRPGAMLKIPDHNEIKHVTHSDAKKVVLAHAADFNEYRAQLSKRIMQADSSQLATAQKSSTGRIMTKLVEDPSALNKSTDKLTLSNAYAQGQLKELSETKLSEEDRIAHDARQTELKAANDRIKELEKNISQLQKLLELKNQNENQNSPVLNPSTNQEVKESWLPAIVTKVTSATLPKLEAQASPLMKYLLSGGMIFVLAAIAGVFYLRRRIHAANLAKNRARLRRVYLTQINYELPKTGT